MTNTPESDTMKDNQMKQAEPFKRKIKYIVFKCKDVEILPEYLQRQLQLLGDDIEKIRKDRNAPPLECVVVESTKPEYESVWSIVQARLEGLPVNSENMRSALNLMLTYFGMDENADNKEVFDAARNALKAKLTTSQVSEPKYQWEYKIDGSDEIFTTELMTNEEFRVFHIDKLIHFERIGSEIPPTITPQEAISPAIAEYIKRLESTLRKLDTMQIVEQIDDIELALASKPTGLE